MKIMRLLILAFAALNPHESSRQMKKKSGIRQRSVLRILLYHFNIRGPLIVGAAFSAITSLVHIFLKVAWLGKFTQTFCKTYCLNNWKTCPWCSRQVINEIFYEKWLGRGSPIAWPPCSPDLTSPDYFLWGFVKERVMAVAPATPDDMKERIRQACT